MDQSISFSPIPGLAGWQAGHVPSTGSTNADLAELAAAGRFEGGQVWLTAGEQSGGRGRRGRGWHSPPGNLYASVLLIDPAPAQTLGQLPLVAAIAARKAVAAEIGDEGGIVQIKWPNDVLIDGAKCTGILLESRSLVTGQMAVIGGIGINIVAHPPDTPYPATHLKQWNEVAAPASLFQHLAEAFDEVLALWHAGANLAGIRTLWLQHARGLGQPLRVNTHNESVEGIFEDMDADGRLVLRLPGGGHKRFAAGDVFF